MSGSFGEMGNLLAQAQKMQKALEEAREELREARIEGVSGGGMASATVDGMGTVLGVHVSEEARQGSDSGTLGDMVLTAIRDAQSRAQKMNDERMSKVTGGMNLPGLL